MGFATNAIHVGQEPDPATGAIVAPIYQTSTYVNEELGKNKGYDYARTNHPNRKALERTVAKLKGGHSAYVFSSGMAGNDALFRLLRPGDHVVLSEAVYGGRIPTSTQLIVQSRLEFRSVDPSGPVINAGASAWRNHMRAGVLENIDIALAYTVIARFLRSKLDIELHRVRDAFALTQGVGQNARIHIHIFILSGSARAPIGNLHRHRRIQLADVLTIPRIARRCHHGCDLGSIQLDHLSVLRVIVAAQALNQRFRIFAVHAD